MTPGTGPSYPQRPGRLRRLLRAVAAPATQVAGAGHGAPGTMAALVCVGVGGIALLVGLLVAPGPTWGGMLVNVLFWTGLAQGGVVAAAAFNLGNARWGRTVQRIALGMGAFLPIALLLFAGLWFGRHAFLPWLDGREEGAGIGELSPWLDVGWLFARNGAALLTMTLVSLALLYSSVRPDLGFAALPALGSPPPEPRPPLRGGAPGSEATLFAAWITRGWQGREAEQKQRERRVGILSRIVVIGYVLAYSLLAIDLSMTLDVRFASTIHPVIYCVGQFYAALAATAILTAAWRRTAPLEEILTPTSLLDLGNLLWGFAMFWAYLSWSQYFSFWMANLPHEAAHHIARWRAPGWNAFAGVALTLTFLLPALLGLSRAVKQSAWGLAILGVAGVTGMWMHRFLDVLPALPWSMGWGTALLQLGVALAFLGLFALSYLWLMRRVPLFPISDPLFAERLAVGHVEV